MSSCLLIPGLQMHEGKKRVIAVGRCLDDLAVRVAVIACAGSSYVHVDLVKVYAHCLHNRKASYLFSPVRADKVKVYICMTSVKGSE